MKTKFISLIAMHPRQDKESPLQKLANKQKTGVLSTCKGDVCENKPQKNQS
jgi:hypothetical protein